MKKPTLTSLKKKAWKELSIYFRIKDADGNGRVQCYTCPVKKFWKKMYAGHFVQGRRPSILFKEAIIKVQCVGCNRFRHGNLNVFTPKMIKEIGLDKVMHYWALAEQSVDIEPEVYKHMAERYRNLQKGCKRWDLVDKK